MIWIYMNNYRGFSDTIIPIQPLTFLVGENSTGKSSFLSILRLLTDLKFWMTPGDCLREDSELCNFHDLVSASTSDDTYFQIGVASSVRLKRGQRRRLALFTFKSNSGVPILTNYTYQDGNESITLFFDNNTVSFRHETRKNSIAYDSDLTKQLRSFSELHRDPDTKFTKFHEWPLAGFPLFLIITIILQEHKKKSILIRKFDPGMLIPGNCIFFDPIRSKANRVYAGIRSTFTPDGENTPYLLRRRLSNKNNAVALRKKLNRFGKLSGLFDSISTKVYSSHPQSPFEIALNLTGTKLNYTNVGYGISQILPLIVEFITADERRIFAVQQPEVHLHPRAQAALGDIIADLAREQDHEFIVETHSDYLIDRCRLNSSKHKGSPVIQVVFFSRNKNGNSAHIIDVEKSGRYPIDQPDEFRSFFVHEEINLLEL